MVQLSVEDSHLKEALKSAMLELLEERRDLFHDLLAEVLEDLALTHAIEEGETSASVSKNEILEILKGRE